MDESSSWQHSPTLARLLFFDRHCAEGKVMLLQLALAFKGRSISDIEKQPDVPLDLPGIWCVNTSPTK